MTLPSRQLFWIASPRKRKAPTTPARVFDVRSAVGRPAKTTDGVVVAAMSGTHSIREECARRAFIDGLRRSASSVATGRLTRIGTRNRGAARAFLVSSCGRTAAATRAHDPVADDEAEQRVRSVIRGTPVVGHLNPPGWNLVAKRLREFNRTNQADRRSTYGGIPRLAGRVEVIDGKG